MAILIKPNGDRSNIENLDLESMQSAVEGYIEITSSVDGKYLFVCNEEGKLNNLPINEQATRMGIVYGAIPISDYFVGNVIIAYQGEIE